MYVVDVTFAYFLELNILLVIDILMNVKVLLDPKD